MLEYVPKDIDPNNRLDYEANISDAVVVLPKLQTGIDVNVKFSGAVIDFELTSESIIFDLFMIPLYHGWLVDPQQEDVVKAVNGVILQFSVFMTYFRKSVKLFDTFESKFKNVEGF